MKKKNPSRRPTAPVAPAPTPAPAVPTLQELQTRLQVEIFQLGHHTYLSHVQKRSMLERILTTAAEISSQSSQPTPAPQQETK